jgi:hypothetical protein
MATRQSIALTTRGNHEIGNLSSIQLETLAYGAIVTGADIDNFTLCELGFNAEGERTCAPLSVATKKGYLVAAPETLYMGEELVDFYNAVGERARVVIKCKRFETSAYALNVVTEVAAGQVAHFDVATKKFLIHAGAHANYASAANKYLVVSNEADLDYTAGKTLVTLEVIE